MNINEVIKNIPQEKIVDFLKYDLKVRLEDPLCADYYDIQDKVLQSYDTISNKLVMVFGSDDGENFITFRLDAFDYELEYSRVMYNKDKKVDQIESIPEHLEGRKKYCEFVASYIEKEYGKEASNKYLDRANQKIGIEEKIM